MTLNNGNHMYAYQVNYFMIYKVEQSIIDAEWIISADKLNGQD